MGELRKETAEEHEAFEAMVCVNCAAPNPLCNEDIPCVSADGERFKFHRWAAPSEPLHG